MGNPLCPENIELLCLDVDGVLTDGAIILNERGEETKRFFVRDGTAIRAWLECGLHLAVITARPIGPAGPRLAGLGVTNVHSEISDKGAAFESIIASLQIDAARAAMVGDDLADLPVFRRCGFPIAVADAVEEVRQAAAHVTTAKGGRGAVREAIELLLKASGRWSEVVERHDLPVEGT